MLSNKSEEAIPPVDRVLGFGAMDAKSRVLERVRHFALPGLTLRPELSVACLLHPSIFGHLADTDFRSYERAAAPLLRCNELERVQNDNTNATPTQMKIACYL